MKKELMIFVLVFVLVMSFSGGVFAATKVFDYGFEDWGGDIASTPLYPFQTTYCVRHPACSEVVTSYDGWTPHSDSYMFIQSDSDTTPALYPLDPPIPGIFIGAEDCIDVDNPDDCCTGYKTGLGCYEASCLNILNNIGMDSPSCSNPDCEGQCGSNPFNMGEEITTGEIFISFWARIEGFDGDFCCADKKTKWIRLYTNGDTYDTVYMHLGVQQNDPFMYFACTNEAGGWLGDPVLLPNAYDGNWHKYSFYVNWNDATIYGWYDVDDETLANYTKRWQDSVEGDNDGKIGTSATAPDYFLIQANFCASIPLQETYHALDDIEVWDGMPTSQPECNDTIDNDGDGAIDFSGGDTGCDDANDDDESNCGDLVCEGGETCLTCVSDCPTNAGEVCCAGTIYTGDCCDDSDCVSPETCVSYVCTLTSTCSPADTSGDDIVSITEIMNYITQWKSGSVTITALMTGIGEWKNGC